MLSPANQNLIVFGHVEGHFALLSHGWLLFFMSVALIQSYLLAKLHMKNKQCTTEISASHLHFMARWAHQHNPTDSTALVISILCTPTLHTPQMPPDLPNICRSHPSAALRNLSHILPRQQLWCCVCQDSTQVHQVPAELQQQTAATEHSS